MNDRPPTKTKVEQEYEELERQLAEQHPGVLDLMIAYGTYDLASRQAEAYLGLLNLSPKFTATDTSS